MAEQPRTGTASANREGRVYFYTHPQGGIILRIPGWDELGERNDAEWSLSDEQGQRLLGELTSALGRPADARVRELEARVEAMRVALVRHNCGTPGCLCYAACRAQDAIEARGRVQNSGSDDKWRMTEGEYGQENGHRWGIYKQDLYESCRECGQMRPDGEPAKPCTGKPHVEFREDDGAATKEELP